MTRKWLAPILALGVLAAIYGYTWLSAYARSAMNLEHALANLAQGQVGLAIKGGEVPDPSGETSRREGGLQGVIETWESPWAFPRPGLYGRAVAALNVAVERNLDLQTGMAIVRSFARLDRRFLDLIIFRIAAIDQSEGRLGDARQALEDLKSLFPRDPEILAKADEQLKGLTTAGSGAPATQGSGQ